MQKMSKNNGITLISLVVTIIVLLILAGIALNLAVGENSIFEAAKRARFESNFRTVEEALGLQKFDQEISQIMQEQIQQNAIGNELTQEEKTKIDTLRDIVEQLRGKTIDQVSLHWIKLDQLHVKVRHQYIIDQQTGQLYEYEGEKYYGEYHHTLEPKENKEAWIPDPTPNEISDLKIYSIEDLVRLSNAVNAGETFEEKTVEVMNSLDFKSEASYNDPQTKEFGDVNQDQIVEELIVELSKANGFVSIGTYNRISYSNIVETPFKGIFDGKGHTIANLYQDKSGADISLGLFGLIQDR